MIKMDILKKGILLLLLIYLVSTGSISCDRCRFKNGKCNNTKVGDKLGIDGETALAWIKNLGLSDYAYNPNHLK